ncbi:hypothetical protein WG66_010607 [Moniliophthora roreri]|nr:hypothetical protein WG66_010607 [Moniliophthora roreri]
MPSVSFAQAASSPSSTGLSSFALGIDLSDNYDPLYYAWIYVLSNKDPWHLRLLTELNAYPAWEIYAPLS